MEKALVHGLVQPFDCLPERDLGLFGLFGLDGLLDLLDGRSQGGAAVTISRPSLLILTNPFLCGLVMRQNHPPRSGCKAMGGATGQWPFPETSV